MNSNILYGDRVIINVGDHIKDCPTDFNEAQRWADQANGDHTGYEHPVWRWDCGFKLDYDGPILRFSSRFYPPKSHYGDKWDGTLVVMLLDKEIHEKHFECETLEELRRQVDKYTEDYCEKLKLFDT